MNGPPHNTTEWAHHSRNPDESELHGAPLVPATEYIRRVAESYRSFERLPLVDPGWSGVGERKLVMSEEARRNMGWLYDSVSCVMFLASII